MEDIIKFLIDFAVQYPQLASIIFLIGSFRVVMKPLVALAKAIVEITPSKSDDVFVEKIEQSGAYKVVLFVVDYIFSIKKIK